MAQNRFGELVRHVAPELEPATSDPLGRPSIDYKLSAGRTPLEFATASVFADAPAKVDRGFRTATVSSVTRSMLEVLAGARSEVIIASPYFPPGSTGMSHIKTRSTTTFALSSSPTLSVPPTSRWCIGAMRVTGARCSSSAWASTN